MAGHFVRWMGSNDLPGEALNVPQTVIDSANRLPDKRRSRFLAARMLLAQLMLRIYGIDQLPPLIVTHCGKPAFADTMLPDFSIAYAGNVVGVLLADEGGKAGLDMEIVRAHSRQSQAQLMQSLTSGEIAWINAQQDFMEAVTQIWTLRQSILKIGGDQQNAMNLLRLHPAAGRLRSTLNPDIQAICDAEPMLVWSCALSPATQWLHLWEWSQERGWQDLRDVEMTRPNIGPRALRLTSLPQEL
ncbi:4'-phosphopantetheinyl transferase family protein [Candidatus Pantoea multigeneris]|uniref:Phosphopantetheinyl transferase n=1 Tax=Candidatus Pantoea multigeneris TaxID=2608357 RepID=A0ABX0RI27_9GAMM|nr:phosphopantetheinyl transferase [Pantoea multigeneris]NIF24469.1 phosphopantetheinyl transferase [Pantoea multigeneris]